MGHLYFTIYTTQKPPHKSFYSHHTAVILCSEDFPVIGDNDALTSARWCRYANLSEISLLILSDTWFEL
ncbi:hypothetical protein L1887_20959 [Cichorium endivia]|nr:hypothetical protein L1887_20959 [Cichorium endivia]